MSFVWYLGAGVLVLFAVVMWVLVHDALRDEED